MDIRWGRLIVGAIAAEAIPIVLLVAIVAMAGPDEASEAQEYANKLGKWVGPVGGAIATFLLAIWATRTLSENFVLHGVILGALVALIDAVLLIASGAPFEWLFVFSGAGRVVAGLLGGYLVSRQMLETVGSE